MFKKIFHFADVAWINAPLLDELYIQLPDWQLSFMAWVCNSFLPLVPAPEHLFICKGIHPSSRSRWQDDIELIENSQWLKLLYPFTNVKNLYLSEGVVPRMVPALQELVEGGHSLASPLSTFGP
jgi:hypothetical protein